MSEIATQLLNTFSSLSASEQHEVLLALLRSSGELSASTLNDDQLVSIAEDVFLSLEGEELHGGEGSKRWSVDRGSRYGSQDSPWLEGRGLRHSKHHHDPDYKARSQVGEIDAGYMHS